MPNGDSEIDSILSSSLSSFNNTKNTLPLTSARQNHHLKHKSSSTFLKDKVQPYFQSFENKQDIPQKAIPPYINNSSKRSLSKWNKDHAQSVV